MLLKLLNFPLTETFELFLDKVIDHGWGVDKNRRSIQCGINQMEAVL